MKTLSKLQSEAVKGLMKLKETLIYDEEVSDEDAERDAENQIKQFLYDQIQKAYSKGREEENKKLRDASSYIFGLEIPEHDVWIDLEFRPQIRAMSVSDQIKCQIITEKLKYWTKVWTWKLEKRLKKQIEKLSIQSKEK